MHLPGTSPETGCRAVGKNRMEEHVNSGGTNGTGEALQNAFVG